MKKNIHPTYEKTTIVCACGNKIETRSTASPEIHVELCSACHPFYTGKQKLIDTAGRVDKFMARRKKAEELKVTEKPSRLRSGQANDKSTEQPKKEEVEKPQESEKASEKIVAETEDIAVVEVAENGEVTVDEIPTHGVPEEVIEKIEEELEENTVEIAANTATDKSKDSDEPLIDTDKSDEK